MSKPKAASIRKTIKQIQKKLKDPRMEYLINVPVKLGYLAALTRLNAMCHTRRQEMDYKGIPDLAFTQSRAIAVVAVDYLNGLTTAEALLSSPLQEDKEIV